MQAEVVSMFGSLGAPEIAIIGVVIILLFGVGKLGGLGKDLGSSVKEFRKAIKDDDKEKDAPTVQQAQPQQVPPAQPTYAAPPQPPVQQYTPPPAPAQPPAKGDNSPGIF
jgi:sec-independent protein translocase protein TatA